MKKAILLLVVLTLSITTGFSQKTTSPKSFKIINESSVKELNYYMSVLSKSNLENFRLKSEDVTLEFENGVKCILFSAQTLSAKGLEVNLSDYKESFPERFTLPKFIINADGHLMTEYKKRRK